MRTITEFFNATLKNALQARDALTAAGKTLEEIPAALGESLKLEGDKLKNLMGALDAVGSKWADLKRVIVVGLTEGENAPSQVKQVGEGHFIVEYYAPLVKKGERPGKPDGKGKGRGGRGGKGRGDGKRGGGRGGRDGGRGPGRGDGRPPRGESTPSTPSS